MRTTRNSTAPKSSPPPPPPPSRRTAAKTPSLDSVPAPRVTKRQAAIKAKQAILNHTPPPPQPHDDAVDVNVGDDAGGSSVKAAPKKGTKRTRGPAKGKAPPSQRIKSVKAEDAEDKNLDDGRNADVEITVSETQVQGTEGGVTNEIVQMDNDKVGAPRITVFNELSDKKASGMEILAVDDVGVPANVHVKEEQEKETVKMKNHLAADFGEFSDVLKTENCSETETISRLSENEEQKSIPMEGRDNAKSEALVVDENITGSVRTGDHNLVETLDEDTKAETMVGADVQHDQDKLNESEETNTSEVDEDPEEPADEEEETFDEIPGKDKEIAHMDGAFCDSGQRYAEVNGANKGGTIVMDDNSTNKDPEEVTKVEEDEELGIDTDHMAGDGQKYEKEDDQGSDTKDAIESFKGIESSKNHGVDFKNDIGEKINELKADESLEGNTRGSVVEGEKFEEEHREWTAVAKERRIKKEHEILIRGIGGDMKEDDLRKVFENIGEVVEVRLHKQSMLNKNKGYAFVCFADKENVKRALAEIKDPTIGGMSCSIGPSEDNDTLFLGNVCNTWTTEMIKQKLKDYGVEGVENITLVPDAQRKGLSRGFAFLEFSCHDDAVVAYQRLQKPGVIFGHAERTAKVAFAEPLRDPDPDVMLRVKTVFVDGLPPTCDEQYLQEKVRSFGEIERIVLARNMITAKRKDFGFVHFTTHEAAVACIDSINSIGLDDGNAKTKIKARLSNPLPKTQAVKGGMAGGFRIGLSGVAGASKPGRGVGHDGHSYRQGYSARGRGSYQHRYAQPARVGFSSDYHHDPRLSGHISGQGSRGGFRPHGELPVGVRPFIPNHVRPMSVPGDASRGMHSGYGHGGHGTKRPAHMTDSGAGYMEPSRRPRLGYADPPYPTRAPYSSHGTQIQDAQGAFSNMQPHNYYGPPANPRPLDYYGPPASARPHDYYGVPNARPYDYYGPPSARAHDYYGPPTNSRPPEYHGPPASTRPPMYYRPPANFRPHAQSVPDFTGGMRPPTYRGNPPYGGGFHY